MKNSKIIITLTLTALLIQPITSLAVSPWFGEEGDKSISATYVTESFDEFWRGENKISGPPDNVEGAGIEQQTLWIHYDEHLADDISYSITTGFTKSHFKKTPPASRGDFDGRADSFVDLKYLLLDEFSSNDGYPTVSVRAGVIIAGTYPLSSAGNPHAPGDGADGVKTSLLIGQFLSNNFSISGELGYQYNNNNVPNDIFYNVGASYQFENGWRFDGLYAITNGQSGTDIGGPGFSPAEFEKLKEERTLVDIGLFFPIDDTQALGFNYANVLDGRNTGKSDIFSLTYVFELSVL